MKQSQTIIPTKRIGPLKIWLNGFCEEVCVPLATFEQPLWPSTQRGAKVSMHTEGIKTLIIHDCMTRSVLVQAEDLYAAHDFIASLLERTSEMEEIVKTTSRYAQLKDWHFEIIGRMIYLRFQVYCGDASGHNMTTIAAEALQDWILEYYPDLKYVSVSANYCTDKKVSAVNGILGRGKYTIAEILIPESVCARLLKAIPAQIVEVNIKKNFIGSTIAGSLRSANAHFANMLLACYLATGQDAANIVEASQGIVHTEVTEDNDLYFSVTLPNLIVGTVGIGTGEDFIRENLELMGCQRSQILGKNAQRLAMIIAATVLCGELSLLAALTQRGEIVRSHTLIERKKRKNSQCERLLTHVRRAQGN